MPYPIFLRKRASAPQMEVRQVRILGWLQAGLSYEEIAAHEGISRQRVRQIVVQALKARDEDRSADRLIRVIDRLDKLQSPTRGRAYDEDPRRKLLAKLNLNAAAIEKGKAKAPENGSKDAASL